MEWPLCVWNGWAEGLWTSCTYVGLLAKLIEVLVSSGEQLLFLHLLECVGAGFTVLWRGVLSVEPDSPVSYVEQLSSLCIARVNVWCLRIKFFFFLILVSSFALLYTSSLYLTCIWDVYGDSFVEFGEVGLEWVIRLMSVTEVLLQLALSSDQVE